MPPRRHHARDAQRRLLAITGRTVTAALDDRLDILYAGLLPPHCGGSAMVGAQVVTGLARRGHALRAIATVTPEQLAGGDVFAMRHPRVALTRLCVPLSGSFPENPEPDEHPNEYHPTEHVQLLAMLNRVLAERPPDVLLLGRENLVQQAPDVALTHAVPTALMIHNTTNLRIMERDQPEARARLLRAQYQAVNTLIAVARHQGERLRALGFSHVRVIENAVDPAHFAPRPRDAALARALGIRDDDLVVAHLSNLKPWKRPLDLVASAALTLPSNPRLLYLVVGDGPLRAAMEDACRRAALTERFRFVGWVDHEHVPAYLSLADLVVMPSHAEARALVYLETQACGRLLLASDVPAAREVIVDGKTGLLFEQGSLADLAAQTLRAAADPDLRARVGAAARRSISPRALDTLLDAYEETLRDLARRRAPACHDAPPRAERARDARDTPRAPRRRPRPA